MTRIEIAQLVANLTVGAVTNKIVQAQLEQHTNAGEITRSVAGAAAGYVVADKLKSTTDAYVVRAAAVIAEARQKKA